VAAPALTADVTSPRARAVVSAVATTAALLVLVMLVLWPLAAVVVTGVADLARVGLAPLGALRRTLELAAASTAITVLLGLAVAYASLRATVPGGALTARLLLLALVLPPFLPALALGVVTAEMAPAVRFPALVLSQVLAFLPVTSLILGHALAAVDVDQEDAAESLGAGRLAIFTRITLAQMRSGLATAATGTFLLCAADLANPLVIGGGHVVLSVETYLKAVRAGDLGAGMATALWLLAPCLAAAVLGGWRAGAVFTTPAARRRPQRFTPASVAVPLTVVTALVALALVTVWAIVISAALVPAWTVDWTPLGASLVLAAAASVLGTVLALTVAGLVGRRPAPGVALLERVGLLPAAVPGLVLGLGYLLAYARPPIDLGTTLWVVVAAVVAARLPVALAAAVAAVRQVNPDVAAVALGLGAGRRRVFSRVVAPVLGPAAASILVYFFVRTLVAVSVVAALFGSRDRVAALTAVTDAAAGRVGDACALAAALSVVVVIVVALRRTLPGRSLTAVWFL